MAPTQLHLIRHAEGYHNLSIESHNIRDPQLTPFGEQQCHKLASTITDIMAIDCIIASAMRRTLYTALITFKPLLEANPNLKIIALPELQETSLLPCDVGSSVDELRLEFGGKQVDLSHVHDGWNDKLRGPFSPETNRVTSRCVKARRFLQRREEKNIAVVSHGGLLHFFTEDWQDSMSGCGTGWSNCELRTFTFDMTTPSHIRNATILETEASLIRRMHDLRPLSYNEQIQLRTVAQASWTKDGYIIADAPGANDDAVEDEDECISATPDSAVGMSPLPLATEGHTVDELDLQEGFKASL